MEKPTTKQENAYSTEARESKGSSGIIALSKRDSTKEMVPEEPNSNVMKPEEQPSNLQSKLRPPNWLIAQKAVLAAANRTQDHRGESSNENKKEVNYLDTLFDLAEKSASKNDFDQAIKQYKKIIKINPKYCEAWAALAYCSSMNNDYLEAYTAYNNALNIFRANRVSNSNSSEINEESGKFEEQLWYGKGLVCQKLDKYDEAEEAFRNGIRLGFTIDIKGEMMYYLGYILKARNNYDEAAKVMSSAILTGAFSTNKIIEIVSSIGRCFEDRKRYKEALRFYEHALSMDPKNPFTLQFLGWLCFFQDQIKEALSYLQKAEKIQTEEEAELHFMIARCHLRLKNYPLAFENFQKCLSINPVISFYWTSFGICFAELKQYKQALDIFNQGIKLNQNILENYYNTGVIYEILGNKKEAIENYDHVLTLNMNHELSKNRKKVCLSLNYTPPTEANLQHPYFMLSYLKLSMKEKLDGNFKNPYNTNGMQQLYIAPASLTLEPKEKLQSPQSSYNLSAMLLENNNLANSNSPLQMERGLTSSFPNNLLSMNNQTTAIQNKFPNLPQYSSMIDSSQMRFNLFQQQQLQQQQLQQHQQIQQLQQQQIQQQLQQQSQQISQNFGLIDSLPRQQLGGQFFNQSTLGSGTMSGGQIIGNSMLGGIYNNSMGIMNTNQNQQDLNALSGLRFNNQQFGMIGNNWQQSLNEMEEIGPSKRLQDKPINPSYYFPNKR